MHPHAEPRVRLTRDGRRRQPLLNQAGETVRDIGSDAVRAPKPGESLLLLPSLEAATVLLRQLTVISSEQFAGSEELVIRISEGPRGGLSRSEGPGPS